MSIRIVVRRHQSVAKLRRHTNGDNAEKSVFRQNTCARQIQGFPCKIRKVFSRKNFFVRRCYHKYEGTAILNNLYFGARSIVLDEETVGQESDAQRVLLVSHR